MKCARCNKLTSPADSVACKTCKTEYHCVCVNSADAINMTRGRHAAWKCSPCKKGHDHQNKTVNINYENVPLPGSAAKICHNNGRHVDLTDTSPIRPITATAIQSIDENLTSDINPTMEAVSPTILSDLGLSKDVTNYIDVKLTQLFEHLTLRFDKMIIKMEEKYGDILDSLNFCSKRVDECEALIKKVNYDYNLLKKDNVTLQSRFDTLQRHVDDTEQRARGLNVEIQNVTERKGENLLNIVSTLANKIGVTVPKEEITAVHRISHGVTTKNRPKNIILKFSKQSFRDAFLAAARLKRGLTTDDIGISDAKRLIYIQEHLTLRNKILFKEARTRTKLKKWKFAWVKNMKIYVRKDVNEPALAICSDSDIQKIV